MNDRFAILLVFVMLYAVAPCCAQVVTIDTRIKVRKNQAAFWTQAVPEDDERRTIAGAVLAPGGRFMFAFLSRMTEEYDPGLYDFVEILGVDLANGTPYVVSPPPAPVDDAIVDFDRPIAWGRDSCAIRLFRQGELPHGKHDKHELWEFSPLKNEVKLLGTGVPLASLAQSVSDNWWMSWTAEDAPSWNGNVQLTKRDGAGSIIFRCANSRAASVALLENYVREFADGDVRWEGNPDCLWDDNQFFYPTDDPAEVIAVNRFNPRFKATVVRRLKLDDNMTVVWERTQSSLETEIGGLPIVSVRRITGAVGRQRTFGLNVATRRDKDKIVEFLCVYDAKTGKLVEQVPATTGWGVSGIPDEIHASPDGSRFAWIPYEKGLPVDRLELYDLRAKQRTAIAPFSEMLRGFHTNDEVAWAATTSLGVLSLTTGQRKDMFAIGAERERNR